MLRDLAEEMVDRLAESAGLSPVGWSQRLGYLLEHVGEPDLAGSLRPFVAARARCFAPLRRSANRSGAKRDGNRKLILNAEIEPDE